MTKTTNPRAALEAVLTVENCEAFEPLICLTSKFQPAVGNTVEACLDGSSNLLAGAEHLARLIVDGHESDVEQTAYCLSFLVGAAKSLVDSANARLNKGVKP